jgi:hypothetical protein
MVIPSSWYPPQGRLDATEWLCHCIDRQQDARYLIRLHDVLRRLRPVPYCIQTGYHWWYRTRPALTPGGHDLLGRCKSSLTAINTSCLT